MRNDGFGKLKSNGLSLETRGNYLFMALGAE
jgi:hypothetical protein